MDERTREHLRVVYRVGRNYRKNGVEFSRVSVQRWVANYMCQVGLTVMFASLCRAFEDGYAGVAVDFSVYG